MFHIEICSPWIVRNTGSGEQLVLPSDEAEDIEMSVRVKISEITNSSLNIGLHILEVTQSCARTRGLKCQDRIGNPFIKIFHTRGESSNLIETLRQKLLPLGKVVVLTLEVSDS
jgi:hypothetical protein